MSQATTIPRTVRGRFSGRRTNLALLLSLVSSFATGLTAQAIGTPAWGNALIIVHGVLGLSILMITPWKTRVAQRGLARRNAKRAVSLLLAGLTTTVLATGVLHSTGTVNHIGPFTVLWVHVATALLIVPLIAWHYEARNTTPRPADISKRNLIRLGGLTGAAGFLWFGLDRTIALGSMAGAERRFTGSHERSSFVPEGVPVTSWLDDRTPAIDQQTWSLAIEDGSASRSMTLGQLNELASEVTADLDCTSGWYSRQVWSGVRLDRLIDPGMAASIAVWSATGYARRFPVGDLERLWVVTRMGGSPLSPGHGFPARLIAPDRRGFWWVKWVVRIEASQIPWWVQLPYPAT